MLTPKLLLRIATCCILFFAFGHSVGHFTRHQVTDPKAKEVQKIMIENKFDMFGQLRSYDQNYEGMSLNLIFVLLAFAVIVWTFSNNLESHSLFIKKLLVPIILCILGFGITSYLFFFFPLPAITCFVATILLALTYSEL